MVNTVRSTATPNTGPSITATDSMIERALLVFGKPGSVRVDRWQGRVPRLAWGTRRQVPIR